MMNGRNVCAVTGANGYIGSRISNHLSQNDWIVYELRHNLMNPIEDDKFLVHYSLEDEIEPSFFEDIDVLVHCAYDFRHTKWEDVFNVNVKGSLRLFESAKKAGVNKIIFISSMSAFEGCKSLYGRAKREIEKEALKIGAIVIRPGLVFGENVGGMIGALNKIVSLSPIIPLVGKGGQLFYLVHEADLSRLVLKFCSEEVEGISKPIVAACENSKTFRYILEILAESKKRKLSFIPIPWKLIWIGLKGSEIMGIQAGFRSDSLISLVNQNPYPDFELTRQIGIEFREFSPQTLHA